MFTDEQIAMLAAKLDRVHVKTRAQAGRELSYIEGWHAISEANRIFGFDGWTRESVEIKCVSEKPRLIGKPPNTRDGYGVTYTARVRVVAGGITREGTGAGHGIDADLGAAHESAIKEAETDAMKRALMTFGNPFGLALYDKDQENVFDGQAEEMADEITHRLDRAGNIEELREIWESSEQHIRAMPGELRETLEKSKNMNKRRLTPKEKAA